MKSAYKLIEKLTGGNKMLISNMPTIGQTIICAETGKSFVVASEGCTFNYSTDHSGRVFSDEGADIREKRELLDRTKPFFAYVSKKKDCLAGVHVTGWKGNHLMRVISATRGTVGFCRHGLYIHAIDVHGGKWYGKNAGEGMCIKMRACK